ncbi:MAG: aldo/keto reductase [Acidobacteriota bacterium]|jgi:predicted aldo/keto reductase-like oxidoreductase|nr:aldo/keto reductase [Acidobacteriota bacterium]
MEIRKIYDRDVSLLGFGLMRLPKTAEKSQDIDYEAASKLVDHAMTNGVNYYDTAYTYGGSEDFAGHALSKYPRDSYFLATKCPPWMVKTVDDFERIFAESLKRCRTDYFDFYLVHNLAQESKRAAGNDEYFRKFEMIGMYDMLKRKKAEGKIRRLGFSFHGTIALFKKLVDKYEWDFAQIQLNYIDWTATDAKSQYEILTERNIPVIIMEPLRGGALAALNKESAEILKQAQPGASLASWGIRYAASLSNVATVLSGMNTMEQLTDNIATMNSFRPVDDREKELLYKAAAIYNRSGAIACTGCRYCAPCPEGVDIPRIFSIYNHYRLVNYRIPFDNGYSTLGEREKASSCIQCGLCVEKCPQHLAIPEHMREIDEFAKSALP